MSTRWNTADAEWEVRWKIGRHKKSQRFFAPNHSRAYDKAFIISGTGNNELVQISPRPDGKEH